MTTAKKVDPKPTVGSNEHNMREHQERIARDKERLKDPNLNEFDKNEIRARLAREEKA